jgi:hypothetical protein
MSLISHKRLSTPAAIAGRATQRFVDSREIVVHEKQRDSGGVVLDLL